MFIQPFICSGAYKMSVKRTWEQNTWVPHQADHLTKKYAIYSLLSPIDKKAELSAASHGPSWI